MQKQIAVALARTARCASGLRHSIVLAGALLASAAALAAPADITRGITWLQAQVQADGQIVGESRVAALQQVRCESAATLLKLAGSTPQVAALLAALQVSGADVPTETLACAQQLRQQLGQTLLNPELEQRYIAGQAYGAYEGYTVPSTLDSGWALSAQLQNLIPQDKQRLLAWLQTQQGIDGSFTLGGTADLMASAVILRGLKDEASQSPLAALMASKAAAYLLGRKSAAGHWSDDVPSTALIYEDMHPYTASDPTIASGVATYLLGQQLPDGSWADDAFVTAVALRALALTAQPALDPSLASLSVKFVDALNNAPLPGVLLTALNSSAVRGSSDGVGRIEQRGLSAGSYQLQASLNGYATLNFTLTLKAGQVLDAGLLQMLVPISASVAVISGVVREQSTNLPLADVTVSVDAQSRSAITAADGRYLISNVTPGKLTVSASKTGYASAAGSTTVLASQVFNFSPLLVPSSTPGPLGECTVQGVVSDAISRLPLAGVAVNVSGAATQATTTDAVGRYSLTGLVSGPVTLATVKAGYDSVSAVTRLACSADRATVLDFSPRLYLATQTPPNANQAGLSGIVMDARTNQPIANAALRVTPDAGAPVTSVSAADGTFRIEGLNAASAQLEVIASGYQGATLQFALVPMEVFDVGQIRLRPPKVEQLLPDLKVMAVRRANAHTDPQSLQLTGTVEIEVSNIGTQSAPNGVAVLAFSDVNHNDAFDVVSDLVLGQTTLGGALAPGQSTTLSINVSGTMAFRDAPVHVIIDPTQQAPELGKANNLRSSAQEALYTPVTRDFKPTLKWEWNGGGILPNSRQVMMAPIAIPTRDTNGDGKVNSDDVSNIVFTSYSGWYSFAGSGVIRILDGRTGAEINTLQSTPVAVVGGIAAADLDGDGVPEIVATSHPSGLPIALKPNGQVLWQATEGSIFYWPSNGGTWSAPFIADLDGDGRPEVIAANHVYDGLTGKLKWVANAGYFGQSEQGYKGSTSIPVVADLFDSGKQNLILGPSVFDSDGTLLWVNREIGDGHIGVADLDGDGHPELVLVSAGKVAVFDRFGKKLWGPVSIAGTNGLWGGPPTIADFDGDGVPDIGVADTNNYSVFRADGSLMWTHPAKDYGSGMTGSTSFDFFGDGKTKILYSDESSVFVMDGVSGATVARIGSDSATTYEYPIIVDADRDGHAEFVTIRNDYGRHADAVRGAGVRVFQDENNAWVPTRSIWNQHAYSINNINDDLSVPANPVPNWKSHNTFRLNKRMGADPRAIADLTVGYLRIADAGALGGSTLTVRVGNAGSYKIPAGTQLAVYNADPALGQPAPAARLASASTGQELQPGQWQDVVIAVSGDLTALSASQTIWIVGDDDGTGKTSIADFDHSNNTLVGNLSAIASNLSVTVSTDKAFYTESEQAVFTALVANRGSFGHDTSVRFTVLDAAGRVVSVLPLAAPLTLAAGASAPGSAIWSVGGVLSGNYQVSAELVTPLGVVYASASANFGVQASQLQTNGARITTDRLNYTAAQLVRLVSEVSNLTLNSVQENLSAQTTISNSGGQIVFSNTESLVQLVAQGRSVYTYNLGANILSPGAYQAQLILRDAQGTVLAQSSTRFSVIGSELTGIGLVGQLQAIPSPVLIGQSLGLQLSASNSGNAVVSGATLRVRVLNPATGEVLAVFSQVIASWPVGVQQNFSWPWPAAGLDGSALVASATVEVAGKELALAQAPFSLQGVPMLQVVPGSLDFGSQTLGTGTNSLSVTVSSVGSATATLKAPSLSGVAAADYAVTGGTCAANLKLTIGSSCTAILRFVPTLAGSRTALISYGLTGSAVATVLQLTGNGVPVNLPLTGTLTARPSAVAAGTAVQLVYGASNPNSQAIASVLTLSIRAANTSTVTVQWDSPVVIGASSISAGNQSWVPTGVVGSQYVATLSATSGTPATSSVLANAAFTVTVPDLQVSTTVQTAAQPRILMLASCSASDAEHEHEHEDSACNQNKALALGAYFKALGLSATVVTTSAEFETLMRCGNYNAFWISAGSQKLTDTGIKELREAAERGNALILDGQQDGPDNTLQSVLGIKITDAEKSANRDITLTGEIYASDPVRSLHTLGQSTRYELQGASTQAVWPKGAPAIISNAIGRGHGLAFGFDLSALMARTDAAKDIALAQLVQSSLSYLAPNTGNEVVADAPVSLQTRVGNSGLVSASVQAQALLPLDAKVFATQPAASVSQVNGQTQLLWRFSLQPGQSQDLNMQVGFASAGSIAVPVQVIASASGNADVNSSATHSVTVISSSTTATNAIGSLVGLKPTPSAQIAAANRARIAADRASKLMQQGRYADSLVQWVSASDEVRRISSMDTGYARQALAQAVQAAERQLCTQGSCTGDASDSNSTHCDPEDQHGEQHSATQTKK